MLFVPLRPLLAAFQQSSGDDKGAVTLVTKAGIVWPIDKLQGYILLMRLFDIADKVVGASVLKYGRREGVCGRLSVC